MVIKIEKITDEVKSLLKMKRDFDGCLEEEKRMEELLKYYAVNNIFEFIHNYPEVAVEENIIDREYEYTSEDYVYQIETSEWLYYLKRKVELEDLIRQFELSELFNKYRKTCAILEEYKTLAAKMDSSKKEKHFGETNVLVEEIFYRVKEYCREIMIEASHKLFVEPLKFKCVKGDTIYLMINSEWAKKRTEERFKAYMEKQFERILGRAYKIVIEAEND